MPKAVRVNKSRRKHRKAEFENYYNKEKEIGTSVTKFEEEDFKCLKKKNQVILLHQYQKKVNKLLYLQCIIGKVNY